MFMQRKFNLAGLLVATALGLGGLTALSSSAQAAFEEYTIVAYDYDGDGFIDETEYIDYSYAVIDYDDDNLISADEWYDYTYLWYDPLDMVGTYDFGQFDYDNDGFYDANEYADAYDSDLYNAWDFNGDGVVSEDEWDEVASVYDDPGDAGLFDW